ncbi:fluoride efflux transporter FluC [Angustibacter sp. McL0619]|uniref:fluoride efflux transporter FluC n=1 Tax=Angustibacter sp. McL0619 TaxID=3415676 RepID=UPI003CF1B3FE
MNERAERARHAWTPARLPVDPDAAVQRPRHVLHPRHWDVLAVIAVGGGLGSMARWGLSQAFVTGPGQVPWGTLLENASGSALLGLLMVFVVTVWRPNRYVRPFLGIGVLGGYTTFSTYALETRDLMASGDVPLALAYLLGSVLAGLVCVGVGVLLGRSLAGVLHHRRGRRRRPGRGPR